MDKLNKASLRQSSREKRNSFDDKYIKSASERACKFIVQTPAFFKADTVLIYYPVKNEISPLPLIDTALKMGKKIAFPMCDKASKTLLFKNATDSCHLEKADFDLLEPTSDCAVASITENTLCIVPALLFSKEGYRIGYGGGYYDRFLEHFAGTSIGLGYSELLVDSFRRDTHDLPLDIIITESEVLYIAEKN